MRARMLAAGVCVFLGLSGPPAWAQNSNSTLEERLAALERRVEHLERENHDLKAQVARERAQRFAHLVAKLARGREHEHLHAAALDFR